MRHTRIGIVGASILYLAGCSDSSEPATTELSPSSDIQPICDGSDDSRLVFAATADWGSVFDAFTAAGGARYLVVDGHCDFVLKENTLLGLRTGHLDAERAMSMAADLEFGRYSSAQSYRSFGCPDCGTSVLEDDSGKLVNAGGDGSPGAPQVWAAAFEGIWRVFAELQAESRPAWQSTRLLAVRATEPNREGPAIAWTAAHDLEEGAVDLLDLMLGLEPAAGISIEDAPTLALLSELRLSALARRASTNHLYVRDANGRLYYLLFRDQPPAGVADAVVSALALPQ